MVRWGVIGAGGFADKRVIPQIVKAKGCSLQAVMVRDLERAKKLAGKHGAKKFYDSVERLLSDAEVDAVYICTPVYLHREHTLKATEAGKHVLCEKPMALNVKECDEMIEACKKTNVTFMPAFMMRFHPAHEKVKQLVDKGVLGDIVVAHAQHFQWYPPTEGAWRQDPGLGGGGVIMDTGSHCIDLLCFLLGKVKGVTGATKNVIFDYPVEDTATIVLDFERGCRGVVENSFAVPFRENHLEIYGTKGSILVSKSVGPFQDSQVKLVNEEGEKIIEVTYDDPYRREFEQFARSIEEGKEPPITGEDGKESLRIIQAAYGATKGSRRL